MFERGRSYTREQIHDTVGGDPSSCLPVVDGRVVAGLFRSDLCPAAPELVLGGAGDPLDSRADAFATQVEAIPVFLQDESGWWRYVGDYRCAGVTREKEVIAVHAAAAGRSDVVCVARLEHQGTLSARLGSLSAAGWLLLAGSLAALALVAVPLGRWALTELPRGYIRSHKSWLIPVLAIPCIAAAALFYWSGARVLRRFGVRTIRT